MSFAGEIVIFGEASLLNVHNMFSVIDTFCKASCRQINFSKSQVISTNNIPTNLECYLYFQKGFSQASDDIKYLGILFIKNARMTSPIHREINKLHHKVENWNLCPLSQVD